jgi:hypothetical protein
MAPTSGTTSKRDLWLKCEKSSIKNKVLKIKNQKPKPKETETNYVGGKYRPKRVDETEKNDNGHQTLRSDKDDTKTNTKTTIGSTQQNQLGKAIETKIITGGEDKGKILIIKNIGEKHIDITRYIKKNKNNKRKVLANTTRLINQSTNNSYLKLYIGKKLKEKKHKTHQEVIKNLLKTKEQEDIKKTTTRET